MNEGTRKPIPTNHHSNFFRMLHFSQRERWKPLSKWLQRDVATILLSPCPNLSLGASSGIRKALGTRETQCKNRPAYRLPGANVGDRPSARDFRRAVVLRSSKGIFSLRRLARSFVLKTPSFLSCAYLSAAWAEKKNR